VTTTPASRPPVPPDLRHLFHPEHADHYVAAMRSGVHHLADALGRVSDPATGLSPEQAAEPVVDVDLDEPLGDPAQALAEMSRVWLDDTVWFHEPAYAAHLNCPVVIPALLAEVFVSGVNASLDTFDQSVGGTFVERHLVDWTAGRIGFGPGADGIFTSGGTQSNLQALLLARDHAVAGGTPVEQLRVVTSGDGHFSVQKAARLLGLGDDAVVTVPVDADRCLDLDALAATLQALPGYGLVPMAVVATAGTTDFGAIDPLGGIADLCERHGAWLHVDAAYGGGLLVSPTRRHRLAGIERADSVTVDFHKTWFQPVSSSALVVADGRTLRHATWHADYLNPKPADPAAAPNQVDKSLQTTRRFDALKLWLTLRIMGPDLVGSYVDRVVDLAAEVGSRVAEHPDLELAAPPQLSTIVFRFRPHDASPGDPACDDDALDALQARIRSDLYERGTGMVAATKVEGRAFLKLTLLNPMATPADLVRLLDAVVASGRTLTTGTGAVER